MSLSGSIIVILYKLLSPVARKFFPHSWRSSVLKMALFFYLFPVPLFKDFILSHIQELFPFLFGVTAASKLWEIDPEYTINMQSNQFLLGVGVILIHIFALCMAVIAFIVIVKQLQQYQTVRCTYLLDTFTEAPPPQFEEWLLRTKEELQVKGNIKIICSKLCDTPITIGVFSPVIIFPALNKLDLEPTDYQYILKHELIHIKNKDLLVKFFPMDSSNSSSGRSTVGMISTSSMYGGFAIALVILKPEIREIAKRSPNIFLRIFMTFTPFIIYIKVSTRHH